MRILTGDECGLLKESIPELSRPRDDGKLPIDVGVSCIDKSVNKMCRSRGIVDLSFCQRLGDDGDDNVQKNNSGTYSFCALRANGSVEHWNGAAPFQTREDRICGGSYKIVHTLDNVFETKDKKEDYCPGRPIAMCSTLQYQNTNNTSRSNLVACCSSMGIVSIIDSNRMDQGVRMQYDAYSKSNNNAKLSYIKGNFENRDKATAMLMDHEAKRIVIGGRERAATMLDVETGDNIWKAKNLPPNPQTLLQQPIWSTAMTFLSQTDTSPIGGSTNLLAIGTAYKQLQIYDVRADATQRRPVLYTPEWDVNKENLLEYRVTSLCQLNSNRIAVGDAAGYITSLDLRKITNQRGRSLSAKVGRFTGPAGSVKQIVKHERLPIITCVGLDRMVRTYDINSRKQLDCVYLKQRLNCALFCEDGTWNDDDDDDDENSVGDEVVKEDLMIEGNIDDDDEVVDYVDSSAEEEDDDESQDESDMEKNQTSSDEEASSSPDERASEPHVAKRRKR